MNREEFVLEVEKLGIEATSEKLEKLETFYNLLKEWNEKINLTTIIECDDVYLKHFYDSLTLAKVIDFSKDINLCDVGSGAGFPGIVLKIFFPNIKITLVDSLNKRVIYLNEVINKLGLKDIIAIHARMEDFSKDNKEKFDVITARAVANLNLLSEISVKALKIGGKFVFMKANCDEEIINLKRILPILELKLLDVKKFVLPVENSNRTLVSMEKTGTTPKRFPRSVDKIKRNPL